MTTLTKPHLDIAVHSTRDLIDYLARGARPPEQWGVGAEMEKLVVDASSGEAASFAAIEALLQSLQGSGSWQPVLEAGRLIALVGPTSSITLEPGGQLELSGQLCPDLHCCEGDFACHIRQIVQAATPLGLAFLGLGVQPFTPLAQIDWVPKSRYGVMGPYMRRTGDMGERMMKQSAGLQVNLDFADEADCFDKLQTALLLAPVLYALFANSPLMDGCPSGYLSTRGEIWSRTDPDRTGLLPDLFRPGVGFADYVEYALDVPMYFIARQGQFLDLTAERFPFRRYLAEGHGAHHATLADWDLHLSTLFPEVRLRPQIEVRCADSLPPRLSLGLAALSKGILYDPPARQAVRTLFSADRASREELYRRSWRLGLKTPMAGRTLREATLEVLELAQEGLRRQQRRNSRGLDETIYLEGLFEIADSGVTLAERLLTRWPQERPAQVAALLEHCGY
ncbi:MAG: glutamate--cysteine ligase [Desulfuromonadales bacterium]|nr:glutamate--cysteine ligase [Desulfuromonadales bacterium]